MSTSELSQLQCFVDDPLQVVGGDTGSQPLDTARLLLLWRALNFQLAWQKAQPAQKVEWIGATLEVVYDAAGPVGVDLSIGEKKVDKMAEKTEALHSSVWIERKEFKEYAGLMS